MKRAGSTLLTIKRHLEAGDFLYIVQEKTRTFLIHTEYLYESQDFGKSWRMFNTPNSDIALYRLWIEDVNQYSHTRWVRKKDLWKYLI